MKMLSIAYQTSQLKTVCFTFVLASTGPNLNIYVKYILCPIDQQPQSALRHVRDEKKKKKKVGEEKCVEKIVKSALGWRGKKISFRKNLEIDDEAFS